MTITYVVQIDGPERLVKIGRTRNPRARLNSLRTGMPWPCNLVALIEGDVERELHRMFAGDRKHGEWFSPSQSLSDWLVKAGTEGRLRRQVPVDQQYINAVIKPRLREYLNGREPTNTRCGDLVCRIFADMLPSLAGREHELVKATTGQVTDALCRGFGPTTDIPQLRLNDAIPSPTLTEEAA